MRLMPRWTLLSLIVGALLLAPPVPRAAADPGPGEPAAPAQAAGAAAQAQAHAGSLTYRARVVHNNRSAISYVSGRVDFATGDFEEHVEKSYLLDWKQLPGRLVPARAILPSVWGVGGHTAQRLAQTLPRFDSPLLRHFILGQLLARPETLAPGAQFLAGQLVVHSADFTPRGYEVIAAFRGAPLVLVGSRAERGGRLAVTDLAVLGPSSELYQYFFEEVRIDPAPLSPPPALPALDRAQYVSFPPGGAQPVAIRPIKDWLVFQAALPNGRPLNLLFDSAAEQMIVDDLVLKLNSNLEPVGDISVSGPVGDAPMELYEGFAFNVGGVEFKNFSVAGAAMTRLGYRADVLIHGIVGNEILQLCKLELNLDSGEMLLSEPGGAIPLAADAAALNLTFIRELPHVQGAVHNDQPALLLLDTGQRMPLSVNFDFLEANQLGDGLMMNGFLGDITGGLMPRYLVEELPLTLGGATYTEKAVDASPDPTFSYGGVPVVGAIGFPLLARHFGGVTFDYSRKLMWLLRPAEKREFVGDPGAWDAPAARTPRFAVPDAGDDDALADEVEKVEARTARPRNNARATPPGSRSFGLDPGGYEPSGAHARNPNTPARAEEMRAEAEEKKAAEGAGEADAETAPADEPTADDGAETDAAAGEAAAAPGADGGEAAAPPVAEEAAAPEDDATQDDAPPPFRLPRASRE